MNAVRVAEDRKKAPVYVLDIFKCLKPPHDIDYRKMFMILLDLYRDDAILADKEMGRFSLDVKNQNSTIRQTEFTLCSDRME